MLRRLHIENIAVIRQADLSFGEGFSVLTGETGAGKSIIIDSINLLAGNRASRDLVRSGEKSATVCAMVIATGRCVGVDSAIFAVACVVAIITMHDAMGVRHETGEQAKVLNQMIDQWIEVSEKNAPFLQNMHLKEMVGHTPLQVVAGFLVGLVVGLLYPLGL